MTTFGSTEGVHFVVIIPVINGLPGNYLVPTFKVERVKKEK